MFRPALIIHGGAGADRPEMAAAQAPGCTAALRAGWQVLLAGGPALDAVCEAVAVLEDDPHFNAGLGSCLTSSGTVEMDATVMDGASLRAGAVAVVRTVYNPIRLARAILDDGRQVMLAGSEAEAFACQHGLKTCRPEDIITSDQLQRWRQHHDDASTGTVGAAAVDRHGHVAAAASTGGILYKRPGRVGDSAIIGAGTYADDALGAASATGHGEAIIRAALARSVVEALRGGSDPEGAARCGIRDLGYRLSSVAGIIAVDPLGRLGYAHNTERMAVGYMRPDLPNFVVRT
ncbi:MAG: isoaspartyl peptidase/L-asparaginase family protein [Candidatus Binatia bacterium]